MSKYENKKITNSTSETRKLFLNFISKTRNKGSSINDINNRTNIFSQNNLNQENNKESDKNIRELYSKEKATTKIDYRHYKTYPIKEIFPFSIENLQKESEEHYWLVTYDKLIKSKKILKILNYGLKVDKEPMHTEHNLKVKYMKIQDYEIFFVKGFDKPFVRPKEDSFILAKLYFLSIKEINKILNYINKTKDKMNIDKYINPNIANNENNICEFLNIKNKNQDEDISYPYCYFYHIGMFMNISMILFTNTFNYLNEEEDNNNKLLYSLPSSKKLYKLIKLLMKSFPEYSANYFMEYLIKRNLYKNYEEKKNEILNLLSSVNISIPNKLLLNKVIRETITGIQTNSSISGSSIHIESNESSKCHPILIENQKNNSLIYNKNLKEFKNSLKSNNGLYINGQVVTTNYLSTNHTSIPYNSIKTLKNSFKNNVPSISIPYEINNAKKERESIGIYLTGSYYNNNQKRIINYCLPKRNKEEEKNEINKKFINKNIVKGKNSEDKENININNILNKKKVEIFTKIGNKSLNFGSIISRNKKKEYKSNNSKIYHTPKKRKKMNYYK